MSAPARAGRGAAVMAAFRAAASSPTIHEALLAVFAVGVIVLLLSCTAGPRVAIAGCNAYASTLKGLAAFREAGELSEDQIAIVDHWRPRLNEICTGDMPTSEDVLRELDAGLFALIAVRKEIGP